MCSICHLFLFSVHSSFVLFLTYQTGESLLFFISDLFLSSCDFLIRFSMAETMSNASTVQQTDDAKSPKKPSETMRPHYYTTFQNYCCGPKANSQPQNKDILPIPEIFKNDAEELLTTVNGVLIENLNRVTTFTSAIPSVFFEDNASCPTSRYLIDRPMLRTMGDAHIINWITSLKMLYPIRTSGKRKF